MSNTEKTILIATDDVPEDYEDGNYRAEIGGLELILVKTGGGGQYARGFGADYVVKAGDIEEEVERNILRPMLAMSDGDIIEAR